MTFYGPANVITFSLPTSDKIGCLSRRKFNFPDRRIFTAVPRPKKKGGGANLAGSRTNKSARSFAVIAEIKGQKQREIGVRFLEKEMTKHKDEGNVNAIRRSKCNSIFAEI